VASSKRSMSPSVGVDRYYKDGEGKTRCQAKTKRGFECRNFTVDDTRLCSAHATFDLKEPHGATKRMDASEEEDENESLASSSSCFMPEYKWATSGDEASTKDNRSVAKSKSSSARKDSDDSSSSTSGDESDDNDPDRPYTHKEFLEMWRACEAYCGEMTEDIENSRLIRGANSKMAPEDSGGQLKAQYGRLLPVAMKVRYYLLA
jgi:hypothetical protein